MSDSTKSTNSQSTDSQQSAVNSQIIDSIKEINKLLAEQSGDVETIASHVLTQAISMAMLNIVNQQQQMYILQNAVTTAAAKAMLNSNPEDAVKLMNTVVESSSGAKDLKDLKDLLSELKPN
jgi:predicted amino acid-binding ACT domain protein